MPLAIAGVPAFVLWSVSAAAQPPLQAVLHCSGSMTNGGVIARRDFKDENGFVTKEIYYGANLSKPAPGRVSTAAEIESCAEENLRVHSVTTYRRDGAGRALVESHYRADGQLHRFVRYEYAGTSMGPSRAVGFAADGTRLTESRYRGDRLEWRQISAFTFDRLGRVVRVDGEVPLDVEFAFRWQPLGGRWEWGIALEEQDGCPVPSLSVNLRNVSPERNVVPPASTFEVELREADGALVRQTDDELAAGVRRGMTGGVPVPSGGAVTHSFSLEHLYPSLDPGRYELHVWHRDARSGIASASNRVAFEIPAQR